MSRNVIILMGPPGSGKGTLSQLCVQRLGWKQLSTGGLCRKHVSEGTPIGKAIDTIIRAGTLIPDELVNQMVCDWIAHRMKNDETLLLDGFPRTVTQAQMFMERKQVQAIDLGTIRAIKLLVSDVCAQERLTGRIICGHNDCQAIYSLYKEVCDIPHICKACGSSLTKRTDDQDNSIRERLVVYRQHEGALDNYFRTTNVPFWQVNGEQEPEAVFESFIKVIGDEIPATMHVAVQQ